MTTGSSAAGHHLTLLSSAAAVFWDFLFDHQQEIQAELSARPLPVSG